MPCPPTEDRFKDAMSCVPTAVTVVTAADVDDLWGITIGSFTSVSLEPLLVSFNVACSSRMHDRIVGARRFAVHLLSAEQAQLSSIFADPDRLGKDQFAQVTYALDDDGIPILGGAIVVFKCASHNMLPAGDHTLIVAKVDSVMIAGKDSPLVYVDRGYRTLGDGIDVPVCPF